MVTTSRCNHSEAKLDPIVRAETCYPIGEQHIAEVGCHLALFNCAACQSTIAIPLPGHVEEDDWNDATPVCDVTTPRCLRETEAVESRVGFVPAEAA